MNRFYNNSIRALRSSGLDEVADDIESYLSYLALDRAALVNELSAAGTPRAKKYLEKLGYINKP